MNLPQIDLNIDFVMAQIKDVKYFYDGMLTICVLTTISDFKIVGTSCAFDPRKYDQIIGMEAARQKATDALFEHCAFYLKTITNN